MTRNLVGKVDFILADLGGSSHQLDTIERGFSFQGNGPLDMRMDSESQLKALDIVNQFSLEELSRVFWDLGEEKSAKLVARAIVRARTDQEITRTEELSEIIQRVKPRTRQTKKHPATKVFQALRILVNAELQELQALLETSLELLKPNGRIAIITFHSLEDRT